MNKKATTSSYNDRLFNKPGLRSYLHNSRFQWFKNAITDFDVKTLKVFELGCFDGKLLEYFVVNPAFYAGYDADWEGGLSDAKEKLSSETITFTKSSSSKDLKVFAEKHFDISAAMETLEHLPVDLVNDYLLEISRITKSYLLVTVPNEKGIVFFFKFLTKSIFLDGNQEYTFKEFVYAVTGQMEKIEQNDHKGFDYAKLVSQISEYFDIVKVEAIPFKFLPKFLGFTVGIIAKPK